MRGYVTAHWRRLSLGIFPGMSAVWNNETVLRAVILTRDLRQAPAHTSI